MVRNELEGAKEARREIKRFQAHINSPRLVPDQCYRMASQTYALVNYVNQLTGLFLSKNYYLLPIFLRRAHEELMKLGPERVSEPYRQLVEQYLTHIAHFIINNRCLGGDEESAVAYIPQALLDSVPGPLPEDLLILGEF